MADLQTELLISKGEEPIKVSKSASANKDKGSERLTIYEFTTSLKMDLRIDNKIGNAWVY